MDPDSSLYMSFLTTMMSKLKQIAIVDNAFEYDSKGKMHFHVLVSSHYVRWKEFCKYCFQNDMYFHFIEVREQDTENVLQYLSKCRYTAEEADQRAVSEYYRNNYGFL